MQVLNAETLKALARNPHYKMSAEQLEQLKKLEDNSMIKFGEPHKHDTTIPIHPTIRRKKNV